LTDRFFELVVEAEREALKRKFWVEKRLYGTNSHNIEETPAFAKNIEK